MLNFNLRDLTWPCVLMAAVFHASWFAPATQAEDAVQLIDAKKSSGGFSFDNGQEFPGAVGH